MKFSSPDMLPALRGIRNTLQRPLFLASRCSQPQTCHCVHARQEALWTRGFTEACSNASVSPATTGKDTVIIMFSVVIFYVLVFNSTLETMLTFLS